MTFPIRARLTAWYVSLLALVLAALGAFLMIRLEGDLVAEMDRSIYSRAAQISLGYGGSGEGEFQDVSDASLVGLPQGEHAAQILSASGQVLESSGDQVAEQPMVDATVLARAPNGQQRLTIALGPDREPFRLLVLPAPNQPNDVLVVATALEDVDASVHRLLVLLLIAGPVALAAAGLVGWWVARKALLPVARITEQAAEIGVDRLDDRVAVPRARDELGRLARTFNAMLDRLQLGVEQKRGFVSDASHELRTPLAVMRSELDVSLRSRGLSAEARDVLRSVAEEVDRMSRIVENLSTLARMDEGKLQLLRTRTEIGEVAAAAVDELRPLAAAKGIRLVLDDPGAVIMADRERLYQALANLLHNAVKYTGGGGEVRVSVWRGPNEAGVTVSDDGPGISREALPHVFDRFFRVDRARARSEGGSGLGLAICREIVQAHGGRVWAESELGEGSSFSLAIRLQHSHPQPVGAGSPQPT